MTITSTLPANLASAQHDGIPERSERCMNRITASLGTVIFLFIAPGFFVVLVPWLISRWRVSASVFDVTWLKLIGVLFIVVGAGVVLDSFARFALQGIGTPAPVLPTRHLVVTGLYRHVRNPLYLASIAIVFGQGLLFANVWLFLYGAALWLLYHLFVVMNEEPTLRKTFGGDYDRYALNVPRWLPRLRRWMP
jgi:protein-S-isoprenylcysteine O-methyltransferase Ste14